MFLCFWCSSEQPLNPKAELLPGGSTNARYAPCLNCELVMVKGITVVEVAGEEVVDLQVGLHLGDGRIVYPTGNWAVVPQAFVTEFQAELGEMAGRYGFCMCEPAVWDLLNLARTQAVEV